MALADYLESKPVIDTPRLRIRPLCADDVPSLSAWTPDEALYTYWGKSPGKSDKNPELLFEKPPKPSKSFHLGIEETASGGVVGELWVYRIERDRMAYVSIRLARNRHGRGYGAEALSAVTKFCFENTELKRLWTEVDARNIPSQKILEKCGYTREGLIRQGKMVNTWCDYYIYGILSTDVTE